MIYTYQISNYQYMSKQKYPTPIMTVAFLWALNHDCSTWNVWPEFRISEWFGTNSATAWMQQSILSLNPCTLGLGAGAKSCEALQILGRPQKSKSLRHDMSWSCGMTRKYCLIGRIGSACKPPCGINGVGELGPVSVHDICFQGSVNTTDTSA